MGSRTILRARAFAKINLSLRILGVRPDGHHELRTVFQSIALHDTLTIRRAPGPFRLTCDDPACPTDETNLVWRAAADVWQTAGRRGSPHDVAVHLAKRIPMRAGLGGGSSDAAAALRAFGALWRVGRARLRATAASLGADVSYFFDGGTVLGLERGDRVVRLADHPPAWVVLVLPPFGVSTTDAYAWFDQDACANQKRGRTPFSPKKGYGPFFNRLSNDLQGPVAKRHPEIARIIRALGRKGASHAAMSGSGSAVFGLFDRRTDAIRATAALATRRRRTVITRTLRRAEYRTLAAK